MMVDVSSHPKNVITNLIALIKVMKLKSAKVNFINLKRKLFVIIVFFLFFFFCCYIISAYCNTFYCKNKCVQNDEICDFKGHCILSELNDEPVKECSSKFIDGV